MKISYIDRKNIVYEKKKYDELLFKSVNRIFLSFPIQVKEIDGIFHCIDGHKRLSILETLNSTRLIPCIVHNDLRSVGLWTPMNSH